MNAMSTLNKDTKFYLMNRIKESEGITTTLSSLSIEINDGEFIEDFIIGNDDFEYYIYQHWYEINDMIKGYATFGQLDTGAIDLFDLFDNASGFVNRVIEEIASGMLYELPMFGNADYNREFKLTAELINKILEELEELKIEEE